MNFTEVCRKCGDVFTFDASFNNDIIKMDVWDESNNYYRVCIHRCDKCGSVSVLQADTTDSLKVYNKYKELFLKDVKKRFKNETISPKDGKKQKALDIKLKSMRKDNLKKIRGKKLYNSEKLFVFCA